MLVEAYQLTSSRSSSAANHLNAARLALDCLGMELCDCQRLRAMYVLALGYAARDHDEDFDQALGWIDEALDQTKRVPEHPSFIDLVDMRGNLNIRRREFVAASEDLGETAARLRALPKPWHETHVDQLLAVLIYHAQIRYYLSDPAGVQRLLGEARELVPLAGDGAALRVADIELTQALLARQLGSAAEAAPIAARAAAAFEGHQKPQSAVRAHVLLAGIYLDISQEVPPGSDQDHYFALAATHLEHARKLAKACDDANGAALITLEHVRLDRLRRGWRDRVKPIQQVIDGARFDNNTLLLVQALTTLGDEYRALGKLVAAKKAYLDALATLGNHEITALAAPIRKALETLD